ncbi:MAG: 3-hydroxyacyl-CoA dehydrogenase NAD-binding domain-containing protein [Beijerinckiaceae bacterium]|nr:3-hydroxyacyl-CoA dehydrogenase NAD-binding domain-containing protein [Beijerinckiaceae bacterium]
MDSSPHPVTVRKRGAVCLIVIDHPPVNAASHAVRSGVMQALLAAETDDTVSAIVIRCEGRTFVAGADIREFGQPPGDPTLPALCLRIEAASKPVVAAIHGTALGGGCEIALACHGRIADASARLGLPEVKLGLIPGAGGTQRLPRLIGVPAAVGMVATGRMMAAAEALDRGLIDAVATGDLTSDAVSFAEKLAGDTARASEGADAAMALPLRRTGDLPVPPFDAAAIATEIDVIERKARGQLSPGVGARCVLAAATMDLAAGLAHERGAFANLLASEQSAALRHVFFAERAASRVVALEGVAARPVNCVGVAGAGTMGAGIAVALAEAGYQVIVAERTQDAAEAGRSRIEGLHQRAAESGRISQQAAAARMAATIVGHDIAAFAPCDLVIEAVFDDLAVKQDLFAALSGIVRPDAVLATNTSYLDPNQIGAAASQPERVVGLHFFSPAHVMRLVEIVATGQTAPDVLATAFAVARRLNKLAVLAGCCDGFIGNRIFSSYRKQCEYMLEDGALPHEIDAAMEAFGLPMGPFAVFDLAGLDIAWARRKRLAATRNLAERYVRIADQLCELGRFGQKSGAGWYVYENGKRRVDAGVTTIIEAEAQRSGVQRRSIGADEIRTRIIAAMVNEGARILGEGMAQRASDIDLVFINGYGWPAWRGGPMFQADRMGLGTILEEVERMQARDGAGWEPAPLLVEMARSGRLFGG